MLSSDTVRTGLTQFAPSTLSQRGFLSTRAGVTQERKALEHEGDWLQGGSPICQLCLAHPKQRPATLSHSQLHVWRVLLQ
jgi:hypothetical protein